MVGYDRFRNGRFRTKQVTESFQTEMEGTRNILRAGHKQARVERRVSPPLLLRAATAHNQPRNTLTPTPAAPPPQARPGARRPRTRST